MELDWKLIITHIIGFVLTVWILKKFAWRPLLDMMEERRQKIIGEFNKIEEDRAEVAKTRADYDEKLKDIDNVARQKMNEAINEGQRVATEIKEKGRDEARELINKAKSELERDVEKARVSLKEDMVRMTIVAAERIINTKLDDSENRRLISEFIDNVDKA
jgi:F-type H+-transporting ATPase subunit b